MKFYTNIAIKLGRFIIGSQIAKHRDNINKKN